MASSSTAARPLLFGIEMEMLIRPKSDSELYNRILAHIFNPQVDSLASSRDNSPIRQVKVDNRMAIRSGLAELLTRRGVSTIPTKSTEYVEHWTIVDESTLDEVSGFCKHFSFVSLGASKSGSYSDK